MLIGLHDAELDRMPKKTFPNYALMKISAWHKERGDTVERWFPFRNEAYDRVYSSKVFSFTPENPYLPERTIKGGTGYDVKSELPPEIDAMYPDYDLYPDCDYAVGFITRGCPNRCPWCVVPEKEGGIKPYSHWKDIMNARWRPQDFRLRDPANDRQKRLVLMDNNILASDYGVEQLEEFRRTPGNRTIDINQGMDPRRVTPKIAELIAGLHWTRYIRFACDTSAAVKPLTNAVRLLTERGVSASKIFVYFLVNDINDATERIRTLRELGAITLYAQAYRDFRNGGKPVSEEAAYFAKNYVYSGQWRKKDWYDTPYGALKRLEAEA